MKTKPIFQSSGLGRHQTAGSARHLLPHTTDPGSRRPRGFALIITITMMLLLSLLVVGMLGLASITTRASGTGEAMALARSQARMGMMIALGELQKELGPDQRVSAPASLLHDAPAQPHVVGAWDGWDRELGEISPLPHGEKADKFRSWLVSSAEPDARRNEAMPNQSLTNDSALLVGVRGNPAEQSEVRAPLVRTDGTAPGTFAWAVFDESMKAAIDLDKEEVLAQRGFEVGGRSVPARYRADTLEEGLSHLTETRNLISLQTAALAGGPSSRDAVRRHFHDLTTRSTGLLTDTAHGGLKRDLTQFFEDETTPPDAGTYVYGSQDGGLHWNYLLDHYQKYKQLEQSSSGVPSMRPVVEDRELARSYRENGVKAAPESERLFPVISKFQLVFSIVSHHHHFADRVAYHNDHAEPRGNQNHAVPHLAYDPVVTLYNPYDVALDLNHLRVRVTDPPVGFRFGKFDTRKRELVWYRPEMASGEFHGLGRFQIAHERNQNPPPKTFTLLLSDGDSESAGDSLSLEPGEAKVFAMRVERSWTWGKEASNRTFFDWEYSLNAGNIDRRTGNRLGVEAVPGWDARAGLQTDHMSYAARPPETLYDYEKSEPHTWGGGFLSMRITDEVRVEAKAQRTASDRRQPDFLVELLAGQNVDPRVDLIRGYRFFLGDPEAEMSEDPSNPVISSQFRVRDTLQKPSDRTIAGKKPFAMLEMAARTTTDPLDDSKAWLYNNPVVEGAEIDSREVGLVHDSYDLRLVELRSFTTFPGVEFDPRTKKGYFGASKSANGGTSNVPMYRVPVAPLASLGDLVHANVAAGGSLPRVTHAFGNSRAHPLIAATETTRSMGRDTLFDRSYVLNNALWDRYYFSGITDYGYSGSLLEDNRGRRQVLADMLTGARPGLNSRLTPVLPVGDADAAAAEIDGLATSERALDISSRFGIEGAFNVNSTSVAAWRALLASQRDRLIHGWQNQQYANEGTTPFPRQGLPPAGPQGEGGSALNIIGDPRWAGFRSLDDDQIERLAEEIVEQIKARGALDGAPLLSLGEFVNRRPGNSGELHALSGLLQSALDEADNEGAGINDQARQIDGRRIDTSQIPAERTRGTATPEVLEGSTAEGAPTMVTQGDLMRILAPIVTVRGDTFKIRSYGEALDAAGNTLATARCEATVQRVPEFVDPEDPDDQAISDLSEINQQFGRRFEVIGFRWLSPDEI